MIPKDVLDQLSPDAQTLLRSVRQAIPQSVAQRWERGAVVLSHTGVELARIVVSDPLRIAIGDSEVEIRGLTQAHAAAERIRALAADRQSKMPQLDLFRR